MLPKKGKVLPTRAGRPGSELSYAAIVAAALREELGDSHRAIKSTMCWTGASERTIKNWFAGTSGPSGEHLVALLRHSNVVLEAVLHLAGREQAVAAKKLLDARDTLVEMLDLITDLTP